MPLWGLSKLVSLGIAGLSSTGEGLYFSPLLSEEQDNSPGQVYDSKGGLANISTFLENEKTLYTKLNELYGKFKAAVEDVIEKKGIKLVEIHNSFQKVSEQEIQLEKEYKASEKLVQELNRILSSHSDTSKKKLEFEAVKNSFHNYNKLMTQANFFMHEWGSQLKKFICVINSKGEASDCEDQARDWLKNQGKSLKASAVDAASSSGGGTDSSRAALEQLDSSRKILEARLQALAMSLNLNLVEQLKATIAEARSEQEQKKYEDKLTFLSKWAETWNNQLSDSVQKSQETTNQLNEGYETLRANYLNWERLKENESVLYRYKSNIQNLLCSLTSSRDLGNCVQKVN